MPALITPFGPDGSVDLAAHEQNVALLHERGIDGIVIGGSNGEGPYLEPGERRALAAGARSANPEGFVMVGIAAESLRMALDMCREAAEAEADAVLVMTPTTLVRHRPDLVEGLFTDVADQAGLPVFLYSVPRVTGVEIAPDAVARLSHHERIVGLKDSGGDPDRCVALAHDTAAGFTVFAGASVALHGAVSGGCHGGVTASMNYVPGLARRVLDDAVGGVDTGASSRLVEIAGLVEGFGVAAVKYAAARLGLVGGVPRRPLREIDEATRRRIDEALQPIGDEYPSV